MMPMVLVILTTNMMLVKPLVLMMVISYRC